MSTIQGWRPGFRLDEIKHAVQSVERLTEANWEDSDLIRIGPHGRLHLGVRRFRQRGRREQFIVLLSLDARDRERYERRFERLTDALAYANGEDGGLLGRECHLVTSVGPVGR